LSIFKESVSYRPFTYSWAVEAEKKEVIDKYWHEGQIDLQDDLRQYFSKDGLTTKNFTHEQNKKTLDTLLLFFTQLDMSVASGYVDLLPYTKNNEIKSLLIQQAAKEIRHQRAYALAGETFGFTDADWSAFLQYKEMANKVEVIDKVTGDLNDPVNYATKLAQILLGEGIGLFSAFSDLLNFKRFGLLIGFNDINSWSLVDEEGHVANNIKILQALIDELNPAQKQELKERVFFLVEKFVDAEHLLIELIGDQEDLTTEQQKDYISFLGRLRLYQIGYIGSMELGNNPLPWMDAMLVAEKHGAFFEKRVTDYTHKKLEGDIDYSKYLILLDNTIN
jgi:ribonucleoside-diphosphate reductase beta chain